MTEKYALRVNSLPEFIPEPIKYLSVVSRTESLDLVKQLLKSSHLYKGTSSGQVFDIADWLAGSGARYYSLELTKNSNKLRIDSRSPKAIAITLDNHTYNHHAYAGRYMRFVKSKPAKGSPEFEVYHTVSTTWGSGEKHDKDLRALVSEVFVSADLVLVSDGAHAPAEMGSLVDLHEAAVPHSIELFVPEDMDTDSCTADASPSLSELGLDEQLEVYEHLSLMHLNALPDYANSHVRATSIYEAPPALAALSISLSPASLVTVANVSPVLFYALASNPNVLSVQATTAVGSHLTINLPGATWSWTVCR